MGRPPPAYRDAGAPPARRTRDLMDRMSLADKAGQLVGTALDALPAVAPPTLDGGPGWLRVTGADPVAVARAVRAAQRRLLDDTPLGIPALPVMAGPLPGQEAFPPPLGLAAGWDTALVRRVATALARRARALGVRLVPGPRVDVPHTTAPEDAVPGGDPLLAAELVAAFVQGVGEVAGVGSAVVGLGTAGDATAGERLLRTRLLPPARAAVLAGAAAVVPAAGANARIPAHADPWLLRDVLRGEWGFAGVVLADATAVAALHERYRVAASADAALALALESGVDAFCPVGPVGPADTAAETAERLLALVRRGALPEWQLDDAAAAVLDLKFRLGLFEDPFPQLGPDAPGGLPLPRPDRELLDAAVAGAAVLVSDPRRLLPLRPGRCAVVPVPATGPAAELAAALRRELAGRPGGAGAAGGAPGRRAETVVVVGAGPPAAAVAELARLSASARDCVLLLTDPRLDGLQTALATLSAVLWCCGAGPATADRVADVLTGARAPSGRLPVPPAATGVPLGHGRSYSVFEYSGLVVGPARVPAGTTVQVSCRVRNTGPLPGREVVQVYVRDRVGSVVRPEPVLAAFSSVGLAPGEGREVRLLLPADRFALWDRGMRRVVEPGAFDVLVGRSARDVLLAAEVVVLPDEPDPPAVS